MAKETTTNRLRRLGYGHRPTSDPRASGREVYHLATGEVMGNMTCTAANKFCDGLDGNHD
jgi:hypothetical protein